jgi:tetratricopeptide (TPR) repeat protein
MQYAGQTHWRFYIEGKRKPDAGRQEKSLADHRQKAVEQLDLSLKQQRDAIKDKTAPLVKQLTETQLLRAETSLEANEFEKALPLLEELLKPILADKPKAFDLYGHRLFVASIRALVKTKQKLSEDIDGQAEAAARPKLEALRKNTIAALSDAGTLLLESGADLAPVNVALIEFSKSLKDDWKLAESKVLLIPDTGSTAPAEKPAAPPAAAPAEKPAAPPAAAAAKPADAPKVDAPKDGAAAPAPAAVAAPAEPAREKTPREKAQDEANACKDAYGTVLLKLPGRTQIALAELIYLADNCSELGSREAMERARVVYQAILERYSKAPPSSKEAAGAIVRCQSKLIALLRGEKKFDEALLQIDDLLKKQPNALEPAMEKASLLQAMAETDPKKYEEAAKEWRALREKLRNPKIVKKPAEYYDIVYNLGFCLYELGVKTKDKTKVEESVSTLKATMTLAPKLGPGETTNYELKVKYEQLLDKGLLHLGRPPLSAKK